MKLIGLVAAPGATIAAAVPEIDRWRARLVLARHGLLDAAEAAVRDYGTQEARAYFEKPTWRADHWLVGGIALLIGLDEAGLTALIAEAQTAE